MSPSEIIIRPAEAGDTEAILDIVEPIIRAGETYPYPPDTPRGRLSGIWLAPAHKVYVAQIGDRLVGTYYVRPNQPGLGNHVCNAGFMVAADAAGRGVGTAIGRHALSEARRLGYRAMQFNLVLETNRGSLAIWDKLGFSRVGYVPDAFRHPREGLVGAHILHRAL